MKVQTRSREREFHWHSMKQNLVFCDVDKLWKEIEKILCFSADTQSTKLTIANSSKTSGIFI